MTSFARLASITLGAAAIAVTAVFAAPSIPANPVPVHTVLYAQPFKLETSYKSAWQEEQPTVTAGYLLVLQVPDAGLLYPSQSAQPMLYIGRGTAERINQGYPSGTAVVIAASPVDENGNLTLDLSKTLIWFGAPALPESVNADDITAEHNRATAARLTPPTAAQLEIAAKAAGPVVTLSGKGGLLRHAAGVIERFVPSEKQLAEQIARETAP